MRRPWPRALAALALAGAGLGALGAVAAQAQEPPAAPGPQASPAAPDAVPGAVVAAADTSVLGPVVAPVIATHGGPTWQPLPEVAAQARAAIAAITEDPMDAVAHGDPAMGCFALVLRLGRGDVSLHRALHDALAPDTSPGTASDQPPLTASDWTIAGDGASVRSGFAFAGDALQGQVRVMSRGQQQQQGAGERRGPASGPGALAGDSMLVACFYNGREPARSARLCERMLPAIEDALQTIPETFP